MILRAFLRAGFASVLGLTALGVVAQTAEAPRKKGGGGSGVRGQARPTPGQWWREIDTGPFISDTFLTGPGGEVAALKGIAIKLGTARDVSVVFDTELLAWRAGFEGTVLLNGTPWDGNHGGNSHLPPGEAHFFFYNSPTTAGVAVEDDWSDPRPNKAGPLPRERGRYRGLFRHGHDVVLHYAIGGVEVFERPSLETIAGVRAIVRTIEIGATGTALALLAAEAGPSPKPDAQVYLSGAPAGVTLESRPDGRRTLAIARGTPAARFKLVYAERALEAAALETIAPAVDLAALRSGGPGLYPQTFDVKGEIDPDAAKKSYAVDAIPLPVDNPWKSPPRFGGFDFFPDGRRIAASTWNGDVWIAEGIDGDLAKVTWRRFASGLYQTLGLKIVDGVIYTHGRDQLTRLRDLNGDGEADQFECFNNDVLITPGFHEFAFDLQTDAAGNFYFSKGMPVNQGGRGFAPWTPHNGTVMRVSPDGAKFDVVAWGLRAPGGVGVRADGLVTTGENEGSWVPACKLTWTPPGKLTFNGVVPGKWDRANWIEPQPGAPTDYDRPLCWIPYYADNSSGSQLWVPGDTTWDARHAGELLHLSYGKSSIFRVLREEANGVTQGGVYRLPIDVSAAAMRARFHPRNGQLYVVGFRGWQTNGRDAFQRVRHTGVNTALPVGLHAHRNGLLIRFSAPVDVRAAEDVSRYSLSKWNYIWGPQYGSGRFSIDQRDVEAERQALVTPSKGGHNIIDTVQIGAAKVLADGRSVFLYVPKLTPAMQMELKLDLVDAAGGAMRETIYHTVHERAPEFQVAGVRWEDIKVAEAKPVGEPGLVLSFNAETTDTLRVDRLALTVPEGSAPSVFIGSRSGAFAASWQGSLVVPERDDFTFSLEGAGHVSLLIDGQPVLSGELPLAAKAPLTLAKGAHAIYASYRSPAAGEARVRLMWSSPQFRTEPVPASAFRFIPGAELESWAKVRAGRELFAAAHCIACHAPRGGLPGDATPELLAAAPSLAHAGDRYDASWLKAWIAAPQGLCPTVAPSAADAAHLASYLATWHDPAGQAAAVPATSPTEIAEGRALVEKLHLAFWTEPLTRTRKWSDAGLVDFLQQPARYHADTRFPDLRLTLDEARKIAAHLRAGAPAVAGSATPGGASGGDPAIGAKLFAASCAACHAGAADASGAAANAAPASPVAASFEETIRRDWTVKGCVAENRGSAPDFRFTTEQKAVLVALRNSDRDVGWQSLRRFAPAEYAASQMKALHCAQCHEGGAGGENKLPDLAFAGEKFAHAWLADLFAGTHPGKIRPWQEARMPAFASRAANLATGLAAMHGVPVKAAAPLATPAPAGNAAPDVELVAIGATLAGEKGYSCVACHDAGARQALQVFEGQGPNLALVGQRLRHDFYQRWMHWPQRVAPATIMPRYTKDRDHAVLDTPYGGEATKQFDAIWAWARSLHAPTP